MNFYNWAGGNQFARNAGGSISNAYYWNAELASDNLAQGPERIHIAKAFAALKQASSTLLAVDAQVNASQPCNNTYNKTTHCGFSSRNNCCTAFVYSAAGHTVEFHEIDRKESKLLLDGKVLFDSTDVQNVPGPHVWTRQTQKLQWSAWKDPVIVSSADKLAPASPPYATWKGSALGRVAIAMQPLEQVNFTEYDSELMVYSRQISVDELAAAVGGGSSAVPLTLLSGVGNAYTVFINGEKAAIGWETGHHGGTVLLGHDDVRRFNCPYLACPAHLPAKMCPVVVPADKCPGNITLDLSAHKGRGPILLSLLSTSLGVTNGGGINNTEVARTSSGVKGIVVAASTVKGTCPCIRPCTGSTCPSTCPCKGAVTLGNVDLTTGGEWHHHAGSRGEELQVYTTAGAAKAKFVPLRSVPMTSPMTWLRTTFDAPPATRAQSEGVELKAVLNLDVVGLSRGTFWVNGHNLGRYWSKSCGAACPHPPCPAGAVPIPCQRYYSIPFDYLKESGNVLTLLDEMGWSDITKTGFAVSSINNTGNN